MNKTLDLVNNNKVIIVAFANIAYRDVIVNWIFAMEKLKITNFVIICLDKELEVYLKKIDIPTLFCPCENNLNTLWVHRIIVIQKILSLGYHVIHSDADAVWIKNPIPTFIENQPFDLIFSQGTIWPLDVYNTWKLVLCCGFFYVKSNPKTLAFFIELKTQVEIEGDDQLSLNRLLFKKIKKWKIKDSYNLTYNKKIFKCSPHIMTAKTETMQIACLPHLKFQRIKEDYSGIYIKHIISNKNSLDIISTLKENKCWYI